MSRKSLVREVQAEEQLRTQIISFLLNVEQPPTMYERYTLKKQWEMVSTEELIKTRDYNEARLVPHA